MQDLKISILQTDLHWESPEANRSMMEEKIWQIKESPDLIVLPEMFTTGFTMNVAACSEPPLLTTHKWMKQIASQTSAVVTGSYIVREGGLYYNRLVWMQPDGNYYTYDKRHLFRMAGEDKIFSSGNKKLIAHVKGWNICPFICYDLRFPIWSRNVNLEYDLLIYVANWPLPRAHAWKTLLQARAIENVCYLVGVNRVGSDGLGHQYSGHSTFINFKGENLMVPNNQDSTITYSLNKDLLLDFRERFPAHLDGDEFNILN